MNLPLKACTKCKVPKPVGEGGAFGVNKASRDGWRAQCRACRCIERIAYYAANREKIIARAKAWNAENREKYRESKRKCNRANSSIGNRRSVNRSRERVSGWSREAVAAAWEIQNGCCAICIGQISLEPGTHETKHMSAHADHCHRTGNPRGLLCGMCNRGIGCLRDCPAILRQAAGYLESYL